MKMPRGDRVWLAGLVVFGGSLSAFGCKEEQSKLSQEYAAFQKEIHEQIEVVKVQGEEIQKRMDGLDQAMNQMEATEGGIANAITAFYARPEEIKHEILKDVDTLSAGIAAKQEDFLKDLSRQFENADRSSDQALSTRAGEIQAILTGDEEFFGFFFTKQDSVNRVFATRFDKKPWYTTILSGWDEKNRKPRD